MHQTRSLRPIRCLHVAADPEDVADLVAAQRRRGTTSPSVVTVGRDVATTLRTSRRSVVGSDVVHAHGRRATWWATTMLAGLRPHARPLLVVTRYAAGGVLAAPDRLADAVLVIGDDLVAPALAQRRRARVFAHVPVDAEADEAAEIVDDVCAVVLGRAGSPGRAWVRA